MRKKSKKQLNYVEAHNKAVNIYQKMAMFSFWLGILIVFASLIGVIQCLIQTEEVLENQINWPSSGFSLSLSLQIYLNSLILAYIGGVWGYIIIMLIALFFGASFALLGYFSTKGKLFCLILSFILYALDFVAMFFVYSYSLIKDAFTWTNYSFTLVTHIIVLVALIIALIAYYQVIDVEKKFNNKKDIKIENKEETEVIASGDR